MNKGKSTPCEECDIENEIMSSSIDSDHDSYDSDSCQQLNEMEAMGIGTEEESQSGEDFNERTNVEMESDTNAKGDAATERATLESSPLSLGNKGANNRPQRPIARRYQWVMPLLVASFLCYSLISSVIRPYEVIIERRQRPLYQRQVFSSFPFSYFRQGHRMLYYNSYNNYNKYYGGNNADDGGNNADDGGNGADDGVYYADNAKNSSYYNATDDAVNSTYYEKDYYEEVIDDFFRYIDDSLEIRSIFPMEISDYAGIICASLSIILSIGGGIGPGAILVAVYIIVMDFPPKAAIPLAGITGLGVTTVSTFLNMQKRHPLSDRPLIDWDLVLIMEPLVLFGAIAGTYINKILDQKVLIVLLVLLLSLIAHNTLKKARKMHHAEELYIKRMLWAKQKRKNHMNPILATLPTVKSYDGKLAEADPPFIPKVHPSTNQSKTTATNEYLLSKLDTNSSFNTNVSQKNRGRADSNSVYSDSDFSAYSGSLQSFIILHKADAESVKSSIIEEESDPIPQNKITYIFTMFLVVIACNIFKGGAGFESPLGILCGSFSFWIVELLTTSWLGFCTLLAGRYLLKRHAIKEAVGFDYVRGDIRWDVRTIVIYPSACIVAGLVSGMFGIGCAVLIAPMLVGIGVNPSVAAATCACMNFFTSLAATSSFVVLGSLSLYQQYAMSLFLVGIISLFVGRWVMSFALHSTKIKRNKRLERHSYMAYSMGLVVLVSALSMTVEALLDVVNHSYEDDDIDGICDLDQMY